MRGAHAGPGPSSEEARAADRADPDRGDRDHGSGGTGLLAQVRAICLALPEVDEGRTHGAPTWFVRRRSFAKFVDPDDHRFAEPHVALWAAAPPGAREALAAADSEQFFGPPFGGSDWIALRLDVRRDGPDWAEVAEIVEDAYRQVAPATLIGRPPRR